MSKSISVYGAVAGPVPLVSFAEQFPDKFFLTITAGHPGTTVDRATGRHGGCSTDVVFEFEFGFGDEIIKKLTTKGTVYEHSIFRYCHCNNSNIFHNSHSPNGRSRRG